MSGTGRPPLVEGFRALRFADGEALSTRIAPPYDVIDPLHWARLCEGDPHNIVHVTLPEGGDDRYRRAAAQLHEWLEERVLVRDEYPTLTVMRQHYRLPDGSERGRTGVFLAVAAEGYETGRVRPHERTHRGPKEDRLALLRATGTVTEPIFLLHRDAAGRIRAGLEAVTAGEPDTTAELDGVGITCWIRRAEETEGLLEALGEGPLYIADGHHRYETTAAFAGERGTPAFVLGFIVPLTDPGLEVLATHRMVRGEAVDREEFLAALGGTMLPASAEEADGTLLLPEADPAPFTLGGPQDEGAAPAERLRIARIERDIVAPLLAAAGERARLAYDPDPALVRRRVEEGGAAAGVLVRPTRVEEVLEVADSGGTMPPKSTYFYPKVPSGIVMSPVT